MSVMTEGSYVEICKSFNLKKRALRAEYCIVGIPHNRSTSGLVIAAMLSRCGHYIFALWFLSSIFFIPRLISAVGDWMFTILPHMVWP